MSDYRFEVFLNFRGPDVRNTLADFLFDGLFAAGVDVFRDLEISMGRVIAPRLLQAIRSSRIAIPIISPQYAQSEWCLDELVEIMNCHKNKPISVFPIFHKVDVADANFAGDIVKTDLSSGLAYSQRRQCKWQSALASVRQIRGWVSQNIASGDEAGLVKIVVAKVLSELNVVRIEQLPRIVNYSGENKRFEVFLNFKGPDVGNNLVDFLYNRLAARMHVFGDKERLSIGRENGQRLLEVIRSCRIAIPIISPQYAQSKWCLNELVEIMDCHKKSRISVFPIFYKVDVADASFARNIVKMDLSSGLAYSLKQQSKWQSALASVGQLPGLVSQNVANGDEAKLVKFMVTKVLSELNAMRIKQLPTFVNYSRENKRFEVFLNFRGPDFENKFVDFLYNRLAAARVHVFGDKERLLIGRENGQRLLEVIKSCRIAIPIISPQYLQSKWCLNELVEIMDRHKNNHISVFPIFYKVDVADASFAGNIVKMDLSSGLAYSLKRQSKWQSALASVRQIPGWVSQNVASGGEANLVKFMVTKVLSELNAMQIKRLPRIVERRQSKWQVFLAFRSLDTRCGFAGHLYKSLKEAGIRVFMFDDPSLIGTIIYDEIRNAIDHSKISIPILSENYASSFWCLEELAQMVKCNKTKQQKILPIFYKVTPSNVRKVGSRFKEDMNNVITHECGSLDYYQRWTGAFSEVGNMKGWESAKIANGRETVLVKAVVQEVSRLLAHT